MSSPIPLSPQQKRRRRNNILFLAASGSVFTAALVYLFAFGDAPKAPTAEAPGQDTTAQASPAEPASPASPASSTDTDAAATTSEASPEATSPQPAATGAVQEQESAPEAPQPAAQPQKTAPGNSTPGSSTGNATPDNTAARNATASGTSTPAGLEPPSAAASSTPDAPTLTGAEATTTAPPDAESATTNDGASVEGTLSPAEAAVPDESATSPLNDPEFSEEELAKLPPWQAGFNRLSKQDRLSYATAFTKAKAAYNVEQWATCLALLNDCELIYNESPNTWNLRACALLGTGALDEAEPHIQRSLALNANDSVALMCQSELLMLRKDYKGSIEVLQKLRRLHHPSTQRALHDAFSFHQLLCHLMLRQEMEARALVADQTPLCDTPLYYFAEAAFRVYNGDSAGAMEPLRSAVNIFGNGGTTSSYRKWMNKCGLADKYVRNKRR